MGRARTPRLVQWAVHATRKAKAHEAPETLYARWRAEAAERGSDADQLVREVTGRARDRDWALSERSIESVFDRLAGPDGLTAQASTFAREDVITALGGGLTGATRSELDALATRRLPKLLRHLPAVLGPERVAGLADIARVRFHAAA
jgi:hypothetical protein